MLEFKSWCQASILRKQIFWNSASISSEGKMSFLAWAAELMKLGFLRFQSCVLRYPTSYYSLLPTCPSHLPLWVSGPSCISTQWGGQGTGCLVSGCKVACGFDWFAQYEWVDLLTHCWFRRGQRLLSACISLLGDTTLGVCAIGSLVSQAGSKSLVSLPSFRMN